MWIRRGTAHMYSFSECEFFYCRVSTVFIVWCNSKPKSIYLESFISGQQHIYKGCYAIFISTAIGL